MHVGGGDRLLLFLCLNKVMPGGVTSRICCMQSMRRPIGVVFEKGEIILIFLFRGCPKLIILCLAFQHL